MSSGFEKLASFDLKDSEISFLSRFFDWNEVSASESAGIDFSWRSIPECLSRSSAVAPSAYHRTGTPISKLSAVPMPKLSLVRLMSHALCLTVSMRSVWSSHQVKIMLSPAIDLRYWASGPSPIISKGSLRALKVWMMSSHSLTKLTNLPTQTK